MWTEELSTSIYRSAAKWAKLKRIGDFKIKKKEKGGGGRVSITGICCFHLTHHQLLQLQELHPTALGPGRQGVAVGAEEDQAGQLGGRALLLVLQQGRRLLLSVTDDQGDLSWVEGSEASARWSDIASISTVWPTQKLHRVINRKWNSDTCGKSINTTVSQLELFQSPGGILSGFVLGLSRQYKTTVTLKHNSDFTRPHCGPSG